jgi:multiple sugar transport system substrate-binding protein
MHMHAKRTAGLLMMSILLISGCGASSTPSPAQTTAPTAAPSESAAAPTAAPSESAATPTAAPSESAAAPTQTAAAQAVTLDLWIFEGEDQILPKFKAGFESAHPNITLNITLVPEDLYVTKLETAFAAGDPPDIAFVYDARWLRSSQFLPLSDLMASNGIDVSKFAQTALSACDLDGTLYCIGSYTGLYVMYYDRQLFDAAGIAYPDAATGMSIDKYAETARKLAHEDSDLSKRVWGATTGGPEAAVDNRAFVSPDGRTAIGYFDDAMTTHTFAVLAQMANNGSGLTWDTLSAMGMGGGTDLMYTHQIGLTPGDATDLPGLQEKGVDVGVAPPYFEADGQPFFVPMWTDQWGVTKLSAHPAEAQQFLVWVATEGQKVRAEAGNLPLDIELAKELNWAGDSPEKQALVAMAEKGRPQLFVPGFATDLSPILDDTFTQVVNNEGDVESIVHEQARVMQEQLDKDWATWDGIK